MDDMNEVEIIERAIDIIVERGWCQRRMDDERGRACLTYALHLASPSALRSVRAIALVAATLEPDLLPLNPKGFDGRRIALQEWNDEPGRTVEDVVLALKHAAAGETL